MHCDNLSKYVMVPYLKGGDNLLGWDCEGLVRYVSREEYAKNLPNLKNYNYVLNDIKWLRVEENLVKEGDLALTRGNLGLHVGIVISDKKILHCVDVAGTCIESFNSFNVKSFWRWID